MDYFDFPTPGKNNHQLLFPDIPEEVIESFMLEKPDEDNEIECCREFRINLEHRYGSVQWGYLDADNSNDVHLIGRNNVVETLYQILALNTSRSILRRGSKSNVIITLYDVDQESTHVHYREIKFWMHNRRLREFHYNNHEQIPKDKDRLQFYEWIRSYTERINRLNTFTAHHMPKPIIIHTLLLIEKDRVIGEELGYPTPPEPDKHFDKRMERYLEDIGTPGNDIPELLEGRIPDSQWDVLHWEVQANLTSQNWKVQGRHFREDFKGSRPLPTEEGFDSFIQEAMKVEPSLTILVDEVLPTFLSQVLDPSH